MKRLWLAILILALLLSALPVAAQDSVTYVSQPERVGIFLNNVAFVEDTITLPADADVKIVLPDQIFQDTLILQENDQRVAQYRINRNSGQILLQWDTPATSNTRMITLTYLMGGLSWKPTYDMSVTEGSETVKLDFFAEIQNNVLNLEDADVRLIAGRVDTSQQLDDLSTVTANQYFAGYDQNAPSNPELTGSVTIQHIYEPGTVDTSIGDTVYVNLLQADLSARRLLFWNAQTDQQVDVIYKVRNESDLPLTEGIVRSYQNGLFIGSDFIEITPIGSEGSVTVGNLQDVRVNRAESRTSIEAVFNNLDTQHEVTMTLSNFSEDAVDIDVVDIWLAGAEDFEFSMEPNREPNNVLRWLVTIPAGETTTITYRFKT